MLVCWQDRDRRRLDVNVCLVLGAGATLANAKHFRPKRMRNSYPPLDTTFFEVVASRRIQLPANLQTYLREVVGVDSSLEALRARRMEEVFKDAFFDLHNEERGESAYMAYVELVDLYVRVLRETTNWLCEERRSGAPVGRLLAAAAKAADVVTVVTFNHDLVIENEIFRRGALRRRWCLDHGYGSLGGLLHPVTPHGRTIPMFQRHREGNCDHDRPITVLKLHGSLNWVVKLSGVIPTANFLRGEGGRKPVHLLPRRQLFGRDVIVRTGKGRTRWRTWPVVVPPVYAKQALFDSAVQVVRDDAWAALESADRVVFYGYSLPMIDVEAEKLFERSLAKNRSIEWLDVIDPSAAVAARYAGLAPAIPIRWFPSAESFFEAKTL